MGAMPPSVEMGYFPPARRNGCTYTLLCPPSSIMYATHRPSGENTAEDSINAVCANGNSFEIAEKRQHPDIERRRKSACDRVGDEPPIAGPIRRRQNHSIRVEEQRVRLTCVDQFLMQRAIARAGAQAPEHHSCAVRRPHRRAVGAGSECLARWHVTIDIDEPNVAIRAVRTIHRDRDPAFLWERGLQGRHRGMLGPEVPNTRPWRSNHVSGCATWELSRGGTSVPVCETAAPT